MEGMSFTYRNYLPKYKTSSRRQPTVGGQPTCMLDKELRPSHCSDVTLFEVDYKPSVFIWILLFSQQTFVYLHASSGENFKWNPVYRTWNKDSRLLWCYTVSTGDSYRHFGRLYSFVFRIKQCNQAWNNGTAWSRRRNKYNYLKFP